MRLFEWLLLGTLLVRVWAILGRGRAGAVWRRVTALALLPIGAGHVWLEGARWSMLGAYAVAVVALLMLLGERPHPEAAALRMGRNRRRRRPVPAGRAVAGVVGVALLSLLPLAFPVWRFPAPTGPYPVGTRTVPVALPGDRVSVARVWYPADPERIVAEPVRWLDDPVAVQTDMAASAGLPAFLFSHLALVRAHATRDAPVASGRYPLVLFEHGLGGFRSQNTFLVEELASHGAVVVAIDHPGDAVGTTLADGTRLPYVGLPNVADPGYVAAVIALGERWAADTVAVARAWTGNEAVPAALRAATERTRSFAVGHSTGGATAVEACHRFTGCRGVLALDPWWGPMPPERLGAGSSVPVWVVESDPDLGYFTPANADRLARFAAASRAPVTRWVVTDGGHHAVADTMHLTPLAALFGHSVGGVDRAQAMASLRTLALALLSQVDTPPAGEPPLVLSLDPAAPR